MHDETNHDAICWHDGALHGFLKFAILLLSGPMKEQVFASLWHGLRRRVCQNSLPLGFLGWQTIRTRSEENKLEILNGYGCAKGGELLPTLLISKPAASRKPTREYLDRAGWFYSKESWRGTSIAQSRKVRRPTA